MTKTISIIPNTYMLRAMSRQNIGWKNALAELIDNSFNAGANRVAIRIKKRTVTVEDDGRGMKDITCAVRLGDHLEDVDPGNGMYGIGMKDAWFHAQGEMEVQTTRNGKRSLLAADFNQLVQQNSWSIPGPVHETAPKEQSGTKVTLTCGRKRQPPQKGHFEQLALIFSPAIESGKQIVVTRAGKSKALKPVRLPELQEAVEETFEIDDKVVSFRIGIVRDGQRMQNGPLWYQHKHRIIQSCALGVHGYSTERIAGVVRLVSGWALTKNKDDFDDNKEQLGEEIQRRCKSILINADRLSTDIATRALNIEIEGALNSAIADCRREKRKKGSTTGVAIPVDSGRRRRKASKSTDNPGSVEDGDHPRQRSRGLTIDWRCLDGETIGCFDSTCNVVALNVSNSFLQHAKQSGDSQTLTCLAMSIFTDWACKHKDGNRTLFEIHDFCQCLGEIMKTLAPDAKEAINA